MTFTVGRRALAVTCLLASACGGTTAPDARRPPRVDTAHPPRVADGAERGVHGRGSGVMVDPSMRGPTVTPRVVWKVPARDRIVSGPITSSGGIAFTSLDGNLYEVTLDGAPVFATPTGAPIRTRPLRLGDRDLLVANEAGDVLRVARDGTVAWRRSLQQPIVADPVPSDTQHIYVAADGIYDIDTDGNVHWHHTEATTVHTTPQVVRPGPSVVYGTIDGRVVMLAANGAERWTTRVNGAVTRVAVRDEEALDGTRHRTLEVYGGGHKHVISMEGTLLSSVETEEPPHKAVDRDGNRYYVGTDHMLRAERRDSTALWSYSLGALVVGPPLLASDGMLVVGADDGHLYALR